MQEQSKIIDQITLSSPASAEILKMKADLELQLEEAKTKLKNFMPPSDLKIYGSLQLNKDMLNEFEKLTFKNQWYNRQRLDKYLVGEVAAAVKKSATDPIFMGCIDIYKLRYAIYQTKMELHKNKSDHLYAL